VRQVLLVGAGFSAGANEFLPRAGSDQARTYPFAADLARRCFTPEYDLSRGIEVAFTEARRRRDLQPFRRLVEELQAADYYLGRIVRETPGTIYHQLFDRFPNTHVLSFNYDGLIELLLVAQTQWNAADGFGVAAESTLPPYAPSWATKPSRIQVLHLHGSLYLYPREFVGRSRPGNPILWLEEPSEVEFVFNPDALSLLFTPFQAGAQDLAYQLPWERFIAPVTDKADELATRYTKHVYSLARAWLQDTELVISIGYRFGEYDTDSYKQLLEALPKGATVLVVSPSAGATVERLRAQFPRLRWLGRSETLASWATGGFPTSSSKP
jgi:hypothetical protein